MIICLVLVFYWVGYGLFLGFVWRVTKDVAGLLFLLRRLTRRGRNAACGQCPASGRARDGRFYRSRLALVFILGDCVRVMATFPGNAVDFILTDPPYLVGFRDRSGRTIAGDKTDEWLQPACNEMYRVLKKDALMVSFYGWNRVDRFMAAWKNAGFSVVGHLVFTKNYTSKAAYVGYRHECAYILAKGRPRLPQNPLPDVLGWKYSGNRHHPTEKPVTSLQPLIESFTHPNAIVLDPFAGSGSTCVAALQSGRRYIGIELLEQYHRAGQQRLAAVQRAMQQGAANDDWFMPEAA